MLTVRSVATGSHMLSGIPTRRSLETVQAHRARETCCGDGVSLPLDVALAD